MAFGSDNGTVRRRGLLLAHAATDTRRLARLATSHPEENNDAASVTRLLSDVFHGLAVPGSLRTTATINQILDTSRERIQTLHPSATKDDLEHLRELLNKYVNTIATNRKATKA